MFVEDALSQVSDESYPVDDFGERPLGVLLPCAFLDSSGSSLPLVQNDGGRRD